MPPFSSMISTGCGDQQNLQPDRCYARARCRRLRTRTFCTASPGRARARTPSKGHAMVERHTSEYTRRRLLGTALGAAAGAYGLTQGLTGAPQVWAAPDFKL